MSSGLGLSSSNVLFCISCDSTIFASSLLSIFFLRASTSALCLLVHRLELAEWPPPQFTHFTVTWMHTFPFPLWQPVTPHWWSSSLWGPAQITHLGCRSPHFPIRSWPIPQQVIHTELGPDSQYFSTTLRIPPNRNPDAHNLLASLSLLTVMTIAEPRLLLVSCCSLKRFSLISHRGTDLSWIPVADSTSLLSNSIFPSPRYLSSGIPWTLSRCQCSRISIPTTAGSTALTARINRFDRRGIICPASAFSERRAEIAPDGAYRTWVKRIDVSSPACCKALFKASIKLASDYSWPAFCGKKILCPSCFCLIVEFNYLPLGLQVP